MKVQPKQPLLTICLPFTRNVMPDWAVSLASLQQPMNAKVDLIRTINAPREQARTSLIESAKKRGSKFVMLIDDDVTFPSWTLTKLVQEMLNTDTDIIGGIYCTKTLPPIPCVYKEMGAGPFYKWRLNEVFEVEGIATGLMMCKTEIFDYIPRPWFKDIDTVEEGQKYNVAEQQDRFSMTDDLFFCAKARNQGFKIKAHGGVLGIHWTEGGTAHLLPDDTYPIQEEIKSRFGKKSEDEKEYYKQVISIYRIGYGPLDILPIQEEVLDLLSQ